MAKDPRSEARRRRQQGDGPTLGSGSNGPIPVVVEAGSPQFLNSLASSLGMDQGEEGQGGSGNPMAVILRSQQAVLQASKSIVDNMQRASDMINRFTQDQVRWANNMQQARQQETAHMANLLVMMTAAAQFGGGGGPGWGGPGGGGPGGQPLGGFPGFPIPPQPTPSSLRPGGGYSVVHGQTTLGNLRQRASAYVHQNWGAGSPNAPVLRAQYNAGGRLTHYTWTRNGRTTQVSPQSPWLPQLQGIVANRAMVSNMAGGFAQSGMAGALRAVPYVGMAMAVGEAANDAAIWLTDQRAANAKYQSIYGGENFTVGGVMNGLGSFFDSGNSNDRSGIAQRIQEQGFVLQNRFGFGGMTEEMSREAFQGVSQLGQNGSQRANSLKFIGEEYEKLGMSVQESLELVRISAQHANSSLSGVAQGLDTVTRAAAATGQNAQMVRQSYMGNYSASLGAAMGAGSGSLATALTMAGIGNNRDLAGLNLGQVFNNPGMMNLLAGQSGQTVGQMQAAVSNGDIRAFTKPLQQRMEQSMISSMNQKGRDDLRNLVGKYGGNSAVARSQGAQRAIVNDLKASGNWNVYAMRQALANVVGDTSGMDDTQVGMAFVATLTGAGPDAQAQEAEGKNQITKLGAGNLVGNTGRSKFVNQFIGENSGSISGTWGGAITELFGGTSAARNLDRAVETNARAYSDYQSSTKSSNPAIEALLTRFGNNTDARVQVQTKQGPRVVTIDEAIKHFSDQISSGQAIIMNAGDSSGLSLAEATGVRVGGFKPGQNGTVDSTQKDAPVGQSIEDYQKANPNKGMGGAVGTVTVSPSPELRRLFNFTGTGGVNIEGAASAGRPPTPTTGPK